MPQPADNLGAVAVMLTCIRLSFVWFSQAPHSLRASMRACRQNGSILGAKLLYFLVFAMLSV